MYNKKKMTRRHDLCKRFQKHGNDEKIRMKDNFKIKITLKYIGIYYSLQFVIRAK